MNKMTRAITCAGLVAGSAGAYAYAANWPTSQLFGRTIVAGDNPDEIALTYDDGPNERFTPRLLDILAQLGVRASFFLIGRHAARRPHLVRAIHRAGHLIGNHTMTHPVLLWTSPARVREELADCNKVLEDAIGKPIGFFRPPHGARRPDVLRTASELGLMPVMWNVTGYDWKTGDALALRERVERRRRGLARRGRGANILLHDGSQHESPELDRLPTLAATRSLVEDWLQAGLRLVTVNRWQSDRG